jgi:IMP dehydrogenase
MSEKPKVADYMTAEVITLSPESTVKDAINLIESTGHDGFPVVKNGKLVGYVSSRDLLNRKEEDRIGEIMARKLRVARPYMDLTDAARVMFRVGFSKLPVIDDDGNLVGIISNADIIRSQIERASPRKVERLKKTLETIHSRSVKVYKGRVRVEELIPTQTKVYADELEGRIYELIRGLAEPLVVVRKGGRDILVDGHHRVVAAMRLGIKEMDAYILEVSKNIKLGLEEMIEKRGIRSVKDIEIMEEPHHPLVEITLKNKEE